MAVILLFSINKKRGGVFGKEWLRVNMVLMNFHGNIKKLVLNSNGNMPIINKQKKKNVYILVRFHKKN